MIVLVTRTAAVMAAIDARNFVRARQHADLHEIVYATPSLPVIAGAWRDKAPTRFRSRPGDIARATSGIRAVATRRRKAVMAAPVDGELGNRVPCVASPAIFEPARDSRRVSCG
jgi:hypothetical protein